MAHTFEPEEKWDGPPRGPKVNYVCTKCKKLVRVRTWGSGKTPEEQIHEMKLDECPA